jgi:hypothetical protein
VKVKMLVFTTIVMAAFSVVVFSVFSDQSGTTSGGTGHGHLELECNISDVDLYLCPKSNFSRHRVSSFFGLVKSHKDECSGDQIFLGTTPFRPVSLPVGKFVLLIPSQFTAENEAPVEILVQPEKKSFIMLKLFKKNSRQKLSGPDAGGPGDSAGIGAGGGSSGGSSGGSGGGSSGGGSGGGSGSAGAVGTGAPQPQ